MIKINELVTYKHNVNFPKVLINFIEEINKLGIDIRITGGSIRDIIWRIPTKDFDFAVNEDILKFRDRLLDLKYRVIETGVKYGTVTVLLPNNNTAEVTMLRKDFLYDGRRPKYIEKTNDWNADSSRRDLTYNACFMDLTNLYITQISMIDLQQRYTRFVGDKIDRIREDALRIYRYFRFVVLYSRQSTYKFVNIYNYGKKSRLSDERISSEWKKIFSNLSNKGSISQIRRFNKIIKFVNIQWLNKYMNTNIFNSKILCIIKGFINPELYISLIVNLLLPSNLVDSYFKKNKIFLRPSILLKKPVYDYSFISNTKDIFNILVLNMQEHILFFIAAIKNILKNYSYYSARRALQIVRMILIIFLSKMKIIGSFEKKITKDRTYQSFLIWWTNKSNFPSQKEMMSYFN